MFILNNDDSLTQLKDMLRILTDDDDALLKNYLSVAESFVQGAVGKKVKDFYNRDDIFPLYKTACFALTGTYYTYRISVNEINTYTIDATANSLIGQMRGKYILALRSE